MRRNVSAMVNIADDRNTPTVGWARLAAGPPLRLPDSINRRRAPGAPTNRVRQHRRPPVPTPVATGPGARSATAGRYLLAGIRIALGWIFLWAFLDKTFGLGHDTTAAHSWLNGGSPTKGFLGSAANGPLAGFYHAIGGTVADRLFMVALLAIGVALILGIGMRLAAVAGAVLTVMMWAAVLPPDSN